MAMSKHKHHCNFSDIDAQGSYLPTALDGLAHYHLAHTDDKVTRCVMKTIDHAPDGERTVHIYMVSDPEARHNFAELGEQYGMKPIPKDCL